MSSYIVFPLLFPTWDTGENGNYCHGFGPGNIRTHRPKEMKYKLGRPGLSSALATGWPPSLPRGKQEREVLGCLPTLPCWQLCSLPGPICVLAVVIK